MAKQLNVNLAFTADTSKAQQQLQNLQRSLDTLLKNAHKASDLGLTAEISESIAKVSELKVALDGAINTKTGTLDLGKFNESLVKSNTQVSEYAQHLSNLGPTGQKAFAQLAQSVVIAEIPLKRTNATLAEFATTLENTVRWQLSSSILHGFMGAVQSAYGYAQDLNESLNDIRIVTGQNTSQMEKFAEKANKAAKALSTTTLEYTNASLIYYQQGLNDSEVADRTAITIKMANAAGQSAEVVSDQLTALWNNFYDGSKSLEYYADVMTALGATTASSTDEISEGLNKFASIAETVGLSYEYAASALATVSATTRQSADVVGTAFKTLFARLQDLELGKTLDDGTTLGKYSAALDTVGINIKDVNGDMKDMDQILDELGNKWEDLSKDTQVALAQTVAGTRQYTQLVALMDNWDYFQKNLSVARDSEGSLQAQADIYAESWEAARDRVSAAAEDIYNDLLNDEFFITITNGFASILNIVSNTIETLGGFKSVVALLGVVVTRVFAKDIADSVNRFAYNIKLASEEGKKEILNTREEFNKQLASMYDDGTISGSTRVDIYKGQADLQSILLTKTEEILSKNKELSQEEQQRANLLLEINRNLGEQVIRAAELREESENTALALEKQATTQIAVANRSTNAETESYDTFNEDIAIAKDLQTQFSLGSTLVGKLQKEIGKMGRSSTKDIESLAKSVKQFVKEAQKAGIDISRLEDKLSEIGDIDLSDPEAFTRLEKLIAELDGAVIDLGADAQMAFDAIEVAAKGAGADMSKLSPILIEMQNSFSEVGRFTEEQIALLRDFGVSIDESGQIIQGFQGKIYTLGDGIVALGNTISSVGAAFSALQGIVNTWQDSDASFGEKLLATFTALETILPIVTTAFSKQNREQIAAIGSSISLAVAKGVESGAWWATTAAAIAAQLAMSPVLVVTLAIATAIAALVAIIWVVVAAFKAWQASTPEAKLKAAEEEAVRLGEELTKAKDAANELRESIESYDTAVDKIKTLKENTEEWRKAIEDANDQARKLIDENEGLEGEYHFNAETGLIEFDKDALENLQVNADTKVSTVQAHKIRADNAVLQAKSNVSLNNVVEDNNKWYNWGSSYQATSDAMESVTLNKLVEAYKATDGNYAEALKSLSAYEQNWIKSLDMTDAELQALCQEVKNNSDAMHENTKQLMNSTLTGDYEYDTSEYKNFITDTMATDMDTEAERLYEEKYKDQFGGMTDADIQKQYAEMMGWDANLVQNKNGNKAIYVNEEGEEVTISDEQVRRALAQSEAQSNMTEKSQDYIDQTNQLAEIEKNAMKKIGGDDGLSMSEYDAYVAEIKKQAASQGVNFSSKEIDKFINQYGSNQRTNSQIILKDSLSTLGNYGDVEMTEFVENISKDLTDEQLELAVDVAASAKSVDDFARQFEQAATAAFIDSLNTSAKQAKDLLNTSSESGIVDQDSLMALGEDKTFQAYLEEQGKTMVNLTAATYSEKMTIISDYYTKLKDMEADALDTNQQNYQEDLASYEAILQYKQAYEIYMVDPTNKSTLADMDNLTNTYGNIDFMAYMDMDISQIQAKIDEIQNSIEEIEAQEVSLNMEWETTEAVEASLKGISGLSKAFEYDMIKMGDSYQMTAEQMKAWAKQYPDLFAQAQATSDGIMELDAAVVEEYIAGQEAQTKASIEKNIAMLEGNYAELEVEKQMLEAERQMAMGEVELEAASATQLMNIKGKLTQYYIDCGYDEAAANNAALTQMGISQKEYNTKTAELTQKTSETQIENANAGAEGTVTAFSTMGEKIKAIFTNLWDATKKLFSLDFDGAWDSLKKSWKAAWTEVDPSDYIKDTQNDLNNIQYSINIPVKYEPSAETPDVMSALAEMYEKEANAINSQMESILTEIAYNKALLSQDLADYGNTDIDTGNDQALEDLTKISERYHEIVRLIAHYERLLDRISKKKDRAFGKNYLNLLAQEKQALEAVYDKQNDLFNLQTAYLATDRLAVEQTFNGAIFQEGTGEIANYTDLLQAAANELNKYKEAYNKSQSDADKKALEWAEKQYDDQIAILEQYEETLDAWNDQADVLTDLTYQIQDNTLDSITTKLEFQIEIDEMSLDTLDFYMNKIADDFYMMAESAALLFTTNDFTDTNKLTVYTNMLNNQKIAYDELVEAHKNNDISQEGFISSLQDIHGSIITNVEALQELDKTMLNYYGNTLVMAGEELAKYIDRMEHQTAVLDHYSSLLEIMGKSNDYKSMGKVLEGKVKTLEDQAAVAKETVEMYKDQAADRLAEYQDALARGDEAAAELYLGQYKAALNAANEAEDAYLSKAEEWAEALKAVLENKLAEAGSDLEKALTGGASFDTLTTQMERANSLQEEYLTTTNKIYETNKMINTAQQAIDKTTNMVAKQKLKSFQEETAQLQNKGKLSQYELEIQQAKYDLLLAEIALEEAQQAKSTVRLQRDSEGNFGYVYTADASQVSDAEQKLADAQNNLYNIGLEGANNYTQKYQETMREMYDTLTEIQEQYLNGEFATEEEYHAAMEEAKAYYYQKLQDYSSLYQVALTTDSRVVADAWSMDFADMTYKTDDWMKAVDGYVDTVGSAFDDWLSQMDTIATDTGTDLDSLEENIKDITIESTNLRDALTGEDGVIAAIDAEATAVAGVTSNYALLRASIQETIEKYEALGKAAAESIKKQQEVITTANNDVINYSEDAGTVGGSGNVGVRGGGNVGVRGGGNVDNSGNDIPDASIDELNKQTENGITITVYASNTRTTPKHTLTINKDSKFTTSGRAIASQEKLPYGSPQEYFYSISHPQSGHIGYINQIAYSTLKNTFPTKFDTGGYTGSWGSEGKLAMLHEKELILNADDTTNFLASLEVLREIVNIINLHSMNAQLSGLLSSPGYIDTNNSQILEQQVTIEASFPGVQDRNEIEEAFNNLINRASQFVNRK